MFDDERDEIGLIMFIMLAIVLIVVIREFLLYKKRQSAAMVLIQERYCRTGAQQHQHANPIYNISGTVQNQDRPTHFPPDTFLSINHLQTHVRNTNETNKPSTYNDAPPSYEEAVKMVTTTTTTTTTVIPGVHRPPPPPTQTD